MEITKACLKAFIACVLLPSYATILSDVLYSKHWVFIKKINHTINVTYHHGVGGRFDFAFLAIKLKITNNLEIKQKEQDNNYTF